MINNLISANTSAMLSEFKPGVSTLFTILIVAATIALILFLLKRIKVERVRYTEMSGGGYLMTKDKFLEQLEKKIGAANKKTEFTLIKIEVQDVTAMKKSLGDIQFASILKELTSRSFGLMAMGAKICYFSDDSLMVYIRQRNNLESLPRFLDMILKECNKPFEISPTLTLELVINISAVTYPISGHLVPELLENIDLAIIESKRQGINNYRIYSPEYKNKETKEYKYYEEIKEAIAKKEFTIYYQPMVNLIDNQVIGGEGLIRWNHKTQGVLAPNKFLHIMEQTGDIYWVGLWSFEEIVKQYVSWRHNYPDKVLICSMNLSAKQLVNPELVSELRRIVKKYKEQPTSFCMEIVEFDLFNKMEVVSENVHKMHQCGFKVAIDDYGLEFSTLSLLETLPIDIIKLSRTFIAKTRESTMTHNIVDMLVEHAQTHNMEIIAEGIEDLENIEYVKSLKITQGQGYYFSKPSDPKTFMQDVILTPWA